MTEENSPNVNGCVPKVVNSWRTLFSSINIGHRIYPQNPVVSKDCEFIIIDSKIRIRVIHVIPENVRRSLLSQPFNIDTNSKRNSLSEEYWFTRNKPVRNCSCNCSFRRSLRYSVISNQPSIENKVEKNNIESTPIIHLPPTQIKNVETFIERLIQDTFFEAFQEYFMLKNMNCNVNLAYEASDDEIVTLRRKIKPNNSNSNNENSKLRSSGEIFANRLQSNSLEGFKLNCMHKKKTQNKPLIILMHGIGSSADVWRMLINNLMNRGFEVIAPDMLGHGYSSTPDKPSYYAFNNLLIQAISVFDHYVGNDDKRKCILIGHSYGCSIITALYPHRASFISQLVLISGGGPTPLAPPVTDNEISPFGCLHNIFYPFVYCGLKRSYFYLSRGKHFEKCDTECGVPTHILEYVLKGQKWSEGDAAFHRRIMVPTLLIHGVQDKQVTLVQECEMERIMPRAFLELIPNAGHLPMLETPEHLTHMILCFLDMWSS